MDDFKVGDYIVYTDGHKYEIGRIKSLRDETMAFVAYHDGETGANTPLNMLHRLDNQHVITSLGGEFFNIGGFKQPEEICTWKYNYDGEYYDTGCDGAFTLIEGTPEENDCKFCPYCGRRIKVEDRNE